MKTVIDSEELAFTPPETGGVLDLTGLPGGGSKIYDRSPYGNTGTIIGASWVKLPGGLWCLSYDGADDYVNCGNHPSLQVYHELTVKAWVKRAVDDAYLTVISKNSFNSKRCWFLRLENNAGGNKARFYISKDGVSNSMLDSNSALTGTGWHLVVATYRFVTDGSSQMRLYLDGRPEGASDSAGGDLFAENGVSVLLGCMLDGSDNPYNLFRGSIALPQLSRHVWTELAVRNVYDREKQLLGAW